ncbi:MAG TPA: energy transducer TonB [Longimicrobium sp.]|nr:energy transducer TonB [Longimicrobium sp.]
MRSFLVLLALAAAAPAGAQQVAANTARVYELHEVEVLPRPQNAAEFTAALAQAYPAHLREAGVGGTVQVAFVIGADGTPGEVRVLSTPDSSFSGPTVQAVSLLRFTPAQAGGQPVAVRVEQPITWRAEPPAQVAAADAAVLPDPIVIPDSIHIYRADEVDMRPALGDLRDFTMARRRFYPHALRTTGTRATVVARFAVDPHGAPQYVHVRESSDPRFDEATLQAVLRLRFGPARRGGEPVWVWMELPVEWSDPGPLASADTADGYVLSEVEDLPQILNRTEFRMVLARLYPPMLRERGVEGQVIVRFRVERDGTITDAAVVSTTNRAFDEPSLRAVARLRLTPGRVGGRPVRTWVEQPIYWSVAGGRPAPMDGIEVERMRRARLSDIVPSSVPLTCAGRPCQQDQE